MTSVLDLCGTSGSMDIDDDDYIDDDRRGLEEEDDKENDRSAAPKERRLVVLLDLDHTVVHTASVRELGARVPQLIGSTTPGLHVTCGGVTLTKIRPHVDAFFQTLAANSIDVHVCTLGTREYAREICQILTLRHGARFSSITAYEDIVAFNTDRRAKSNDYGPLHDSGLHMKYMNASVDKTSAIVVDDTREVWSIDDRPSLYQIRRYFYPGFVKGTDEDDDDCMLTCARVVLDVNARFSAAATKLDPESFDASSFLEDYRSGILRDLVILFEDDTAWDHYAMQKATAMGALCLLESDVWEDDDDVTHVVSRNLSWNSGQGVELEVEVVHPRWVHGCWALWKRLDPRAYRPPTCNSAR